MHIFATIIHFIKLKPSSQENYPGTSETSDENTIVVEADCDLGGPPGVVSRLGLFGFVFSPPEDGYIVIYLCIIVIYIHFGLSEIGFVLHKMS